MICQGERRLRIIEFLDGHPFFVARVERVPEPEETGKNIDARLLNLRNQALELLQLLPQTPGELVNAIQNVTSAPALADLIASFMDIAPAEKQELLETFAIERRLERVSEMLGYRLEVLRLSRQISDRTKETIDDRQREFLLREQLKTIQKELGEGDDAKSQEVKELADKIARAKMPEEVETHAKKELARLERMPEASGEYSMERSYLEWLVELPWSIEFGRHGRCCGGAPHSRRRPLRVAQSQATDPRIPRHPKAEPAWSQPDPVLRRAAWRWQDLAWTEHRPRDRAQIRAGQPGRNA